MSTAGRYYTESDRAKMVNYIIQHRAYHRITKVALFKEMERDKVVIGRTSEGLRKQFKAVIIKNIRKYCDDKNAETFERMWPYSIKKTSGKTAKKDNSIDSTAESKISSFMSKTSQESSKAGTSKVTQELRSDDSDEDGSSVSQPKAKPTRKVPPRVAHTQEVRINHPALDDDSDDGGSGAGLSKPTRKVPPRVAQTQEVRRNRPDEDVQSRGVPYKVLRVGQTQVVHRNPPPVLDINSDSDEDWLMSTVFVPTKPSNVEKYTVEEDRALIRFLAQTKSVSHLELDNFWKDAMRLASTIGIKGRSWKSLKSRFFELKKAKNLDYLNISSLALSRLGLSCLKTSGSTAKKTVPSFVKQPFQVAPSRPIRAVSCCSSQDSKLERLLEELTDNVVPENENVCSGPTQEENQVQKLLRSKQKPSSQPPDSQPEESFATYLWKSTTTGMELLRNGELPFQNSQSPPTEASRPPSSQPVLTLNEKRSSPNTFAVPAVRSQKTSETVLRENKNKEQTQHQKRSIPSTFAVPASKSQKTSETVLRENKNKEQTQHHKRSSPNTFAVPAMRSQKTSETVLRENKNKEQTQHHKRSSPNTFAVPAMRSQKTSETVLRENKNKEQTQHPKRSSPNTFAVPALRSQKKSETVVRENKNKEQTQHPKRSSPNTFAVPALRSQKTSETVVRENKNKEQTQHQKRSSPNTFAVPALRSQKTSETVVRENKNKEQTQHQKRSSPNTFAVPALRSQKTSVTVVREESTPELPTTPPYSSRKQSVPSEASSDITHVTVLGDYLNTRQDFIDNMAKKFIAERGLENISESSDDSQETVTAPRNNNESTVQNERIPESDYDSDSALPSTSRALNSEANPIVIDDNDSEGTRFDEEVNNVVHSTPVARPAPPRNDLSAVLTQAPPMVPWPPPHQLIPFQIPGQPPQMIYMLPPPAQQQPPCSACVHCRHTSKKIKKMKRLASKKKSSKKFNLTKVKATSMWEVTSDEETKGSGELELERLQRQGQDL